MFVSSEEYQRVHGVEAGVKRVGKHPYLDLVLTQQ
jgi:hypothetical protein